MVLLTKRFEGLVGVGVIIRACVFSYVPSASYIACGCWIKHRLLCAVAAVELRKAVLVVDVRGGDDVSGEQLRFVIIPFLTKLYIQRYGYVLVKRLIQCVQDVLTLRASRNNLGRAIQSFVFEYCLFFPKRHCSYGFIIRYAKVAKLNLQRQAEIDNIRMFTLKCIVYPYIFIVLTPTSLNVIIGVTILRFKIIQCRQVR